MPDRARPVRWGHYAARIGLVIVLLAAAAALPTSHGAGDRLRYREGEIARERIVAPYDFGIHKDDATMRREQEEAALAVLPVFVADATQTLIEFGYCKNGILGQLVNDEFIQFRPLAIAQIVAIFIAVGRITQKHNDQRLLVLDCLDKRGGQMRVGAA